MIVVDSTSGAPVALADVRIAPEGATPVPAIRVTTDTIGRATAVVPDDERLLITVRRLGYEPATLPIAPSAEDDMLVIALAASAARLAPTITRAEPRTRRLELAGFYEREQRNTGGTFLDSAAIAKRKPYDLYSLLKPYMHDCTALFLDGLLWQRSRDVKIEDVLAVEIYHSNSEAPVQFANPMESLNRCGSIAIWLRF